MWKFRPYFIFYWKYIYIWISTYNSSSPDFFTGGINIALLKTALLVVPEGKIVTLYVPDGKGI